MKYEKIIEIVCKDFEISPETLQVKIRRREIMQPRQICHFFVKQFTNLTVQRIGDLIGKKDHATVLHSCKTVLNLMETDKKYYARVQGIERQLMIEALKDIQPKLSMSTYTERKSIYYF